jgi:hypothetical protein
MKMRAAMQSKAGIGISAATLMALVMGAPKFGEGVDWFRKLAGTTEIAYAGYDAAIETKTNFEKYIEQQEQELKLEKQRQELQREFNEKLVDIQQQQIQQQVPNMPAYQPPIPQPEIIRDGDWCCQAYAYDQCWDEDEQGYNRWYKCE